MNKTKVINLAAMRELLFEWERVRAALISGAITGFHTGLRNASGSDTIYLGGVFREDPQKAVSAILRASAARAMTEDDAPPFKASQM